MVDTSLCQAILMRAIKAYDSLILLYSSDIQMPGDFASHTVAQATIKRDGLLERMKNPVYLLEAFTGNYVLSIQKFLDEHWDDYREFPVANSEKFGIRERLHAELLAVTKEIGQIKNQLNTKK